MSNKLSEYFEDMSKNIYLEMSWWGSLEVIFLIDVLMLDNISEFFQRQCQIECHTARWFRKKNATQLKMY